MELKQTDYMHGLHTIVSLSLSLCLCLCVSLSLSVSLCLCVSVYLCICEALRWHPRACNSLDACSCAAAIVALWEGLAERNGFVGLVFACSDGAVRHGARGQLHGRHAGRNGGLGVQASG